MIELNNGETKIPDTDFSENVLKNQNPVLMEFSAKWSGPCHILEPIINDIARLFNEKIKVYRVDIDNNLKMKEAFGICEIPTLLFFKNGKMVDHIIGTAPKQMIYDKLNEII